MHNNAGRVFHGRAEGGHIVVATDCRNTDATIPHSPGSNLGCHLHIISPNAHRCQHANTYGQTAVRSRFAKRRVRNISVPIDKSLKATKMPIVYPRPTMSEA
jgi:hypothetical protein